MANQDWVDKDFYAVLGVPPDATQDVVKKAYRKLARANHPDTNNGNASSERRFKEIGEAYGVLSDPEQRRQYDAIRTMTRGGARFTAGGAGQPGGGAAGFEDLFGGLFTGGATSAGPGGVRYSTSSGGPGGGEPSLEDLLSMFGDAAGPGPQRSRRGPMGFRAPPGPRRGEDLLADATLSFRQAVDGTLLSLRVDSSREGPRTITARIPAGVREGQKVRLRGKGAPGAGGEDGDLVITVHVENHPVFSLDGANVRVTVPVTFPEAAMGADIEVPTIDGTPLRMRVPAGTPSGRVLRAKGRGVVTAKATGDLLVTVQVVVPQRIDGAAKEALEAFVAATAGENPRAAMLDEVRREGAGAGDGR